VHYVLDMAEIPSFALDRSLDAHGTPTAAIRERWAAEHARAIAPQLTLTVDGRSVPLTATASSIRPRPGAGGLPTLYFTADYRAAVPPGPHNLVYRDDTEPGRLGWRDVVLGDAREPTDELRAYPSALIGSPRSRTAVVADLDARGRLTADQRAAAVANDDSSSATPLARSNALSDALAKGASDPLIVLGALLLAVVLGALHALEPGHGKTLLAVSLVGARATARQAVILASALTIAHTAGVLVTVLGARAVAREVRARLPFAHVHAHAHPHAHAHEHAHTHAGGAHEHHHDDEAHARSHAVPGSAPLTFRSAVLAAASGNVAPCPAALVVLLAAIGLHRIGYGMVLIVAFSIGLAAVLTILGIAVVRGAAWLVARPRFDRAARFAPLVTAAVIATVGAVMLGQGFVAQGIGVPVPVIAVLVLTAIAGYALAWHRHELPSEARA